MAIRDSFDARYNEQVRGSVGSGPQSARPAGVPLSVGGRSRNAGPDAMHFASAPSPATFASGSSVPDAAQEAPASHHNLQRALGAFRLAMPFVQKLVPLLDTHLLSAVASVLSPVIGRASAPIPSSTSISSHSEDHGTIDLSPIKSKLDRLQTSQIELSSRISEQNQSLKRVEDQLEMVREATDRNTLEQQELLEDLKSIGHKVNVVTLVILAMLLSSLFLNLILYLHIERVLP